MKKLFLLGCMLIVISSCSFQEKEENNGDKSHLDQQNIIPIENQKASYEFPIEDTDKSVTKEVSITF